VEAERDALLAVQQGAAPAPAAMLLNIKGIGPEFAAILWSEGLFRHFDNRRQVASYAGLTVGTSRLSCGKAVKREYSRQFGSHPGNPGINRYSLDLPAEICGTIRIAWGSSCLPSAIFGTP
jgi:hypothetical protein